MMVEAKDGQNAVISFLTTGAVERPPLNIAMRSKRPRKTFYICNRKRCRDCSVECHHTADISFALYEIHDSFELMGDGSLWEKAHRGET